jgi:hypothetical protein
MTRPELNAVAAETVWPPRRGAGLLYCTISEGQRWDGVHPAAYDIGGIVLELDGEEIVKRAYMKPDAVSDN